MNLIRQPRPSKLCGQCCVAMLTDTPVEQIIKLVGHNHGTRTHELVRVLRMLGFSTVPRLKVVRGALPERCICKALVPGKAGWHWVVHYKGKIYDPDAGIWDVDTYNLKITSFLPVQ